MVCSDDAASQTEIRSGVRILEPYKLFHQRPLSRFAKRKIEFSCKNILQYELKYILLEVILFPIGSVQSSVLTLCFLKTVIFQQIAHKPTKFKEEFAAYVGEMYPVRLCLHVLPDASLHVCRRFLVGPVSECLGAFGFLRMFSSMLDFAAKSWGIGRQPR